MCDITGALAMVNRFLSELWGFVIVSTSEPWGMPLKGEGVSIGNTTLCEPGTTAGSVLSPHNYRSDKFYYRPCNNFGKD